MLAWFFRRLEYLPARDSHLRSVASTGILGSPSSIFLYQGDVNFGSCHEFCEDRFRQRSRGCYRVIRSALLVFPSHARDKADPQFLSDLNENLSAQRESGGFWRFHRFLRLVLEVFLPFDVTDERLDLGRRDWPMQFLFETLLDRTFLSRRHDPLTQPPTPTSSINAVEIAAGAAHIAAMITAAVLVLNGYIPALGYLLSRHHPRPHHPKGSAYCAWGCVCGDNGVCGPCGPAEC